MQEYIGIPLDEGQLAEDVMLLLLLGLFLTFSVVFRTNINLFYKMIKDIWQVKERQNLFENISGNEFFYDNFMTFQTLFLSAVSLFSIARLSGFLTYTDLSVAATGFLLIFLLVYLLYAFKKISYRVLGFTFAGKEKFRLWKTNYHAIMRTFGITLYIPVCLMVFIDNQYLLPVILFVFLYFLCRFVILYKSIGIFLNKKHGFFYINLYLCGLEILLLALLYQASIYLYNFIEASAIWH
ncbi:MAG: DUF4271 domain-containing protein [Tannerellaceae bacterium]|nr:DUF4271 domain-containing protein [Tannerellaceae bacterium]